jgi:methionyl-tRNA formyltransferase
MKRVVFLGSKAIGYYCLAYLIQEQQKGKIEIVGVITKANAALDKGLDIQELIEENNLPTLASLEDIPNCDNCIVYNTTKF